MPLLDEFYEAADRPFEYARKALSNGARIIGYFCSYTPEEIIFAAGAHPMRLFGEGGEIRLAEAHLQSYCCAHVRGALEAGLSGRLDFLNGAVFPHACDSMQRLSDLWRLNTAFGFFSDIVLPVKLDTESARDYFVAVLRKFRKDLGAGLGVDITELQLARANDLFNRIRGNLTELYRLRAEDPGSIRGRDLAAIIRSAMAMNRDRLSRLLPEVVEAVSTGDLEWSPGTRKRVLLVGGLCDQPDLFDLIEAAGGVVVGDDLCTGHRWFTGQIPDTGDPLTDLAARYFSRSVCPAKHRDGPGRGGLLADLARDCRAQGVIVLQQKFCDPLAFDYPYLKAQFNDLGIPVLLLEIEDRLPPEGQLLNRLETFISMMG